MQQPLIKFSKKLAVSNPTLSVYNTKPKTRSTSHKISSKSRTIITENSSEHSAMVETFIKPSKTRHITLNVDTRSLDEAQAQHLEDLLFERLAQVSSGKNCKSELEVMGSIFDEICDFFHKFRKILRILKEKFEKCVRTEVLKEVNLRVERVKRENENLVKKINLITQIHETLQGKYEALKENQNDYERILIKNPGFIVNYHNIVDITIKQAEKIDLLKAENRALRAKIHENQVFKAKQQKNQDFLYKRKNRSLKSAGEAIQTMI